MKHLL